MNTPKNSRNSKIKVLLVENSLILRAGLKLLLEKDHAVQVSEIDTFATPGEFLEVEKPDVVVISRCEDSEERLNMITKVRGLFTEARILLLVRKLNTDHLRRAVTMGVAGIVRCEQTPETLIRAVERVSQGEVWLERTLMAEVIGEYSEPQKAKETDYESQKMKSLTRKEREVVNLIGEGLRNKEIAKKLYISDATVRHHLSSIFSKLEVEDRLGLIVYALRYGLINIKVEAQFETVS